MKKLMSSSMVIGLLFAAASCSSDSKTTTTTTATAETTSVSTADTAAGSAVTTGDATAASVDATGLSALQTEALANSISGAAAKGITVDPTCLKDVIVQLSDADAKLIVDAGPAGNPTLSAAGEALGSKALACAVTP